MIEYIESIARYVLLENLKPNGNGKQKYTPHGKQKYTGNNKQKRTTCGKQKCTDEGGGSFISRETPVGF